MATENEKSSFTGYGCAYSRIWSGIRPSREIFEKTLEYGDPSEISKAAKLASRFVENAPYFEARFRLTERILDELHIRNTCEIASGLSPHFFRQTQYVENTHVEIDLPGNMALKRKIVANIAHDVGSVAGGWYLLDGSAMDEAVFNKAVSHFTSKRGTICFMFHGLLRYVSAHDREILIGQRIAPLAKNHKVIILTSDIELLSEANATAISRLRYDNMAHDCGFDVRKNLFRDEPHAKKSFTKYGGRIQERSLLEVRDELVSPKHLCLNPSFVETLLTRLQRYYIVRFGRK